jgi:peptidyl-prolyl cis-trans isomerase D
MIEAVDRSGRTPDGASVGNLPQGVDVLNTAFSADVGVESDPLSVPGGGYAWIDVIQVTRSRERTLEEVKDRVAQSWREQQIAERLKTKATEITEKLKGGKPLAEVAAEDKLKVETASALIRNQPAAPISGRALELIFRTPKDAADTVEGERASERVVFVVTEINLPPLDPQSAEGKRVEEALRASYSEDLLSQYIMRLETDLGTTINTSVLAQIYGSGEQN